MATNQPHLPGIPWQPKISLGWQVSNATDKHVPFNRLVTLYLSVFQDLESGGKYLATEYLSVVSQPIKLDKNVKLA